jgi:xanthine/CO dehydrogenase XdhC/CoxF family maturation factor
MDSAIGSLLPLFERERAAGNALALGLILDTVGSTYRKRGALMLFASSGEYAGLLSGGCLEGDLNEYACEVIRTGEARIVSYDLRRSSDELWGLGLGCEGAMHILLLRMGPSNDWQPLDFFSSALAGHEPAAVAIVTEAGIEGLPLGSVILRPDESNRLSSKLFYLPLSLAPRILLLGAGPDAVPVVEFAARLGWQVTVADHRPGYVRPERFPQAVRLLHSRAEELVSHVELDAFEAAIIMSHHLAADRAYLNALAQSQVPFVGLLGPPARRRRLLEELGPLAAALQSRLRAPVGLPLGGRAPESIALSIVAQLHAHFHESQ